MIQLTVDNIFLILEFIILIAVGVDITFIGIVCLTDKNNIHGMMRVSWGLIIGGTIITAMFVWALWTFIMR